MRAAGSVTGCLASSLQQSYDATRKAVSLLRVRTSYRVEVDRCTVCRNHRVTIVCEPSPNAVADSRVPTKPTEAPMFDPRKCVYCGEPVLPDGERWRWVGAPDIGFKVHLGCEDDAREKARLSRDGL